MQKPFQIVYIDKKTYKKEVKTIKTEKNRILWSILLSVILAIILTSGIYQLSNKEVTMASENKDTISLKLTNTKSISIYNVLSNDINDNVYIKDPEIIKQVENLFNKASFSKCTTQEPTRAHSLFISFYTGSSSTGLFICSNDIVVIDGIKYQSEDITFAKISTLLITIKSL